MAIFNSKLFVYQRVMIIMGTKRLMIIFMVHHHPSWYYTNYIHSSSTFSLGYHPLSRKFTKRTPPRSRRVASSRSHLEHRHLGQENEGFPWDFPRKIWDFAGKNGWFHTWFVDQQKSDRFQWFGESFRHGNISVGIVHQRSDVSPII